MSVKKTIARSFTVETIEDGVSYCFVFTKAAARVDENNTVTAELAGYAYKYVGGVRSALASTTIRHGYILTDSDTYADTTTNSSGFFDAGTWFDGDDITEYGKNSPSIFAAIVIDGTVVHTEMITISVKGSTGNRGKVGRFFYYAGEWDDFASTDSFLVNDAQAPYFYYNNNYWVFNPETNGTYTKQNMGTPSSSSSNWKVMTSDFKYIITEAIFGAYAHFGSAIINGDWLISQHGTINGVASTNYTSFDPDHPADDNTTNFVPNYCVDLLTGASYQQNAYIRGTIYSTNGVIGGFEIGENKIGGISEISGGFQGTSIYSDGRALIGNMNYDYGLRTTGGVEMVGNGKNIVINTATGSPTNHGFLLINGYIKLINIPRSAAGLQSGEIYVDSSGNVKMVL